MIDLELTTEKQKITIAKCLCDYCYIMNNWDSNDANFKEVYYNFYLKARWAVINKQDNIKVYFEKLQSINPDDDFMNILDDLKANFSTNSYEFSLASKLLHTRNPEKPIYDSKVRNYLSSEENVDFWWRHSPKVRGASKGLTERQKIEHDWIELNNWYKSFINSPRYKQWIRWFDINFPNYVTISNIKKIDFIVFASR